MSDGKRSVNILRYLFKGGSVKFGDYTYEMDEGQIGIVMERWIGGETPTTENPAEEILMIQNEFSFNYFVKCCESMPESAYLDIVFSLALSKS
jgi:hypothetical protein